MYVYGVHRKTPCQEVNIRINQVYIEINKRFQELHDLYDCTSKVAFVDIRIIQACQQRPFVFGQ